MEAGHHGGSSESPGAAPRKACVVISVEHAQELHSAITIAIETGDLEVLPRAREIAGNVLSDAVAAEKAEGS